MKRAFTLRATPGLACGGHCWSAPLRLCNLVGSHSLASLARSLALGLAVWPRTPKPSGARPACATRSPAEPRLAPRRKRGLRAAGLRPVCGRGFLDAAGRGSKAAAPKPTAGRRSPEARWRYCAGPQTALRCARPEPCPAWRARHLPVSPGCLAAGRGEGESAGSHVCTDGLGRERPESHGPGCRGRAGRAVGGRASGLEGGLAVACVRARMRPRALPDGPEVGPGSERAGVRAGACGRASCVCVRAVVPGALTASHRPGPSACPAREPPTRAESAPRRALIACAGCTTSSRSPGASSGRTRSPSRRPRAACPASAAGPGGIAPAPRPGGSPGRWQTRRRTARAPPATLVLPAAPGTPWPCGERLPSGRRGVAGGPALPPLSFLCKPTPKDSSRSVADKNMLYAVGPLPAAGAAGSAGPDLGRHAPAGR
jgi:hypothetical protein